MFTSTRNFLINAADVFRVISSANTSCTVILVITEIMGFYFISNCLLMRMNLPMKYRVVVSKALGNIHFNFYHRWFDFIFLISALSTIALFIVKREISSQDFLKDP